MSKCLTDTVYGYRFFVHISHNSSEYPKYLCHSALTYCQCDNTQYTRLRLRVYQIMDITVFPATNQNVCITPRCKRLKQKYRKTSSTPT